MEMPTHPASAASTFDDATLLVDGGTASQQPRPWPSWATRRLCGVVSILVLVATGIWATGMRQAVVVVWASPPPLSPSPPPPPLPPTEAAEAAEVAEAAQAAQSEGGRACVMESGSPYLRENGDQVNSCGHDAYCCAGGAQAGKSNCVGVKSAESTAAALGLTTASIRACCHTGGYTPNAPAHITVAADGLQEAHQPCDWYGR